MKKDFSEGYDTAIVPEGTSKSTGRVPQLKSGAYYASHIRDDQEIVDKVLCTVLGNTHDYMSGDPKLLGNGKKALIFANLGESFYYESVQPMPDEPWLDYVKRDKKKFLDGIKQQYLDLNTVTAAQLTGVLLLNKAERGDKRFSLKELKERLITWSDRLEITGINVDRGLKDNRYLQRVGNMLDTLVEEDYTDGRDINIERVLYEPDSVETYRKDNVLKWSANKLLEVVENRPAVKQIISN